MPAPPSRRARRRLVLAAGCALLLASCGTGEGPAPVGAGTASGAATAPATSMGTFGGTVTTEKLPVYWVGVADGGQRLFREFRDAPRGTGVADPIGAAAALMTTGAPEDPDYRTLWAPVDRVGSSTSPDGTITVDMPARAFRSDLTDEDARLAVQQLVHTVTAAATLAGLLPERSEPEVVVLVDGEPGQEVFGSVRLDGPVRPAEDLEAPIWVVDPQQGALTAGAVTISGRVLEGVRGCRWTVTDRGGGPDAEISSGELDTEGAEGEFRAEVELEPGEYVVTVIGRDAEGRQVLDDKDVVVSGP